MGTNFFVDNVFITRDIHFETHKCFGHKAFNSFPLIRNMQKPCTIVQRLVLKPPYKYPISLWETMSPYGVIGWERVKKPGPFRVHMIEKKQLELLVSSKVLHY